MFKKGLFLILSGLLFGAFLGGLILFNGNDHQKGPVIGSKVENFDLPGINGQSISLSQYRGKTILLNFWATWCIPCEEEMPLLQDISQVFSDELVVIGINSQESEGIVQSFIAQNRITFPIALDASGELVRKFLINGYPATFFVDSSGILRNLHIGVLREDQLLGYLMDLGVQ